MKSFFVKGLLTTVFTLAALAITEPAAVAADVSVRQVYEAAQAGHLTEAQTLMQQVLREHPTSGKAHFVEAELLARQGQLATARTELETAERLEPGLPFAKPESVLSLRQRLSGRRMAPQGMNGQSAYAYRAERRGPPWGLLLLGAILIGAIVMFVRALTRRTAPPAVPMGYGNGFGGPGPGAAPYGPSQYGPYGQSGPYGGGGGGGIGSGIVGGLATGAALGAGLVAGEALAHRLGGEGGEERWNERGAQPLVDNPNVGNDMGGEDFGLNDDSSWDDSGGGGDAGGGDWS